MDTYFGTYARFDTKSKKDSAVLLGADCLVGDKYSLEFETVDNIPCAWVVNKFDMRIGYLEPQMSRQASVMKARGWTITALLSFVAYTDTPEPGEYWGEVALITYDPAQEAVFTCFIQKIQDLLMDGIRPDINLSDSGVAQALKAKGDWAPDARVPFPQKKRGTAIVKKQRKMSEKMIEQGRKGNVGCYVISWVFILALVALVIFALKSCGVF